VNAALDDLRVMICSVFGMTEIGTVVMVPREDDEQRHRKPGTIGVPVQNILMKVSYIVCSPIILEM